MTEAPVEIRRKEGMCWCCNGWTRVRNRQFWMSGIVRPLCASCEKDPANQLNRLPRATEATR